MRWLLVSLLSLAAVAAEQDMWAPWRQPAKLVDTPYRVQGEPRVIPWPGEADSRTIPGDELELPWSLSIEQELTATKGVELRLRFRVDQVPAGRLQASHSLAHFILDGEETTGFWLHAYSGNSGFMLNGLAHGRRPPWQRTLLARGAVIPHAAVPWDTAWHTVAIAWCRGRLAVTWYGLPILHVADPSIAYRTFGIARVRPGPAFGKLHLAPLEVCDATFAERR